MDLNINTLSLAKFETSAANSAHAKAAMERKYPSLEKAQETAESFEAIFISQMLAPMFETVPKDEMFGGGNAESIYRGMQIEEYGKTMAKGKGLGIAENIMAEILKNQEFPENDPA